MAIFRPVDILRFKKLVPHAVIPKRGSVEAAGLDLVAAEDTVIDRGCRSFVSTGLAIAIATGFEGQVRPRSGLAAKNGVTVLNTPGTIDSDYRGELKVILVNTSNIPFFVKKGDRIAQLVIAPVVLCDPVEVEEFDETERGEKGFGSTGVSS